ncbi:MotB family protein [Methylobacterium sp. 37f]|uniref:MotB family protein n=1 Tax=Methylobacterium sp. 37f TaxID=2817058 RepID=UPI001FFC9BAB|nr:MotB family protein [Methylobacterium sp. 37f]MCK2053194.1 MotB family protein [Methylobacterium sp. 37f]
MADDKLQEIIIIRRRGGEEEGHHGGAWKIALADFMTAMMALFLVLWLIGSTTKETKSAIAEYFNPVKLADSSFDRRGLRDPQNKPGEPTPEEGKPDGGTGEGSTEGKTGGKSDGKSDGKGASAAPGTRAREAALFQDPYAVLAKLAAEIEPGPETASADAVATETGEPGIKGGEAARDPFDPLYWQVAPLAKTRTEQAGSTATVTPLHQDSLPDARGAAPGPKPAPIRVASALPGETDSKVLAMLGKPDPVAGPKDGKAVPDSKPSSESKASEVKTSEVKTSEVKTSEAKAPEAKASEAKVAAEAAEKILRDAKQAADAAETAAMAEIKAEIAKVLPSQGGAPAPRTEVRRTGEGILISLTDEVNFSMFSVGSAEPQAKVVRALEQVARILKDRPGRIIVRGHTDARPFRSEVYDNWRLSSARAQMASYMLVRGGVADARLERIEGYADRQPRNGADPKAAENRRIEILLRARPE